MDWGARYQRDTAIGIRDKAAKKKAQNDAIQYIPDGERAESPNDTASMQRFTPRQAKVIKQKKKAKKQFGKSPKV